jgi:farnesyl diphosphate synthase
MSLINTASSVVGVDDDTLHSEFEEKLLLDDDGAPQPARCYERQRERHRCHGEGGAGVDDGYRERFVRAYERLRDELVSDDSCELTDEARRWIAQV